MSNGIGEEEIACYNLSCVGKDVIWSVALESIMQVSLFDLWKTLKYCDKPVVLTKEEPAAFAKGMELSTNSKC